MNPNTIVYFAELNPDNSISKIIEMSANLSFNTANSTICRSKPHVKNLRRSQSLVGLGTTFGVVYSQYTYQLYPSDGSLLSGGSKTYAWDSGNSCWTSGSSSYTWNNTSFSWDVS